MKEIPYSVICAAQNGDTDAIALIRRHFEGFTKHITWHQSRHTAATTIFLSNAD